jgi:hypothetical protein
VLNIVDSDEGKLIWEAYASVGGLIILIDEELLWLSIARVLWLLLWLSWCSTCANCREIRISCYLL